MHVAIDDHNRRAYLEIHRDERDLTCAEFLHRAVAWFRARGVRVLRVLTDNALVYRRGSTWAAVCGALPPMSLFLTVNVLFRQAGELPDGRLTTVIPIHPHIARSRSVTIGNDRLA